MIEVHSITTVDFFSLAALVRLYSQALEKEGFESDVIKPIPSLFLSGEVRKGATWLGFVQGQLAMLQIFSIAEMREHNRRVFHGERSDSFPRIQMEGTLAIPSRWNRIKLHLFRTWRKVWGKRKEE